MNRARGAVSIVVGFPFLPRVNSGVPCASGVVVVERGHDTAISPPNELRVHPRRDLIHPRRGMFAQAGAAEVDALAAPFAFERVAVGAGEGEAGLPERRLRGAANCRNW